jgi:GNAT superfamily N-acetyltransferase
MDPEEIRIEVKRGAELQSVIPAVVRLRTEVFRDWPYLYDGDPVYEKRNLGTYTASPLATNTESPRAAVVVALANEAIVGASIGVPLVDESDNVKAPFVARGWDPARFFYYGEFMLRREFRGRGIGAVLFAALEAHAKAVSDCDPAVLATVVRLPDHPASPPGYMPIDGLWAGRGFTRRPDLVCRLAWKEVGTDRESEHELVFWMKSLSGTPLPP